MDEKFLFEQKMSLYYFGALVFATAIMVVWFMLLTSGNFQEFKDSWNRRIPKITELPIVTSSGQIVNSVEDLDMQLEFLENQLEEKEKEMEVMRKKKDDAAEKLEKLTETTNQVKKFYVKMKIDVTKSENEIFELRDQIDDYKERQLRLRDEVNENVKYYTGMLDNIESTVIDDGYEMVKKSILTDTIN